MKSLAVVPLFALMFVADAAARGSSEPAATPGPGPTEEEVRLPQVLFISARDSDRPLDFLERYGAMTSREIGSEIVLPGELPVVRLVPIQPLGESETRTDSSPPATETESTSEEATP